jgi:riboflavin synthase
MFTGIIEEIGKVRSVRKQTHSLVLTITAEKILEEIKTGDSICTDGVCLTVTSFSKTDFSVDVMPETFQRSSLGKLVSGDAINLERALRLTDRLGGHLVTGHIDGTGKISRIRKDENAIWYSIVTEPGLLRYIVEKGSIAVNGISLTVAKVDDRSFDVSLIPLTQEETTLAKKTTGSIVNIECDVIGKYIEKLVAGKSEGITLDFLQQHGF